jgi:hypothetical protein
MYLLIVLHFVSRPLQWLARQAGASQNITCLHAGHCSQTAAAVHNVRQYPHCGESVARNASTLLGSPTTHWLHPFESICL